MMISYIKKFLDELILATLPESTYFHFLSKYYIEKYGPKTPFKGLFQWEEDAIKNYFPKPPGRILVGAAGAGREMISLSNLGYRSSGFEPILISANHAKRVVPKESMLAFKHARYEDFVKFSLKDIEDHAPYDGAIVGWGSLTHVLDPKMHMLILKKFRKLCPSGPILVSFLTKPYTSPKVKLLRKLFSIFKLRTNTDSDSFSFKLGFYHRFTRDEIADLAKSTGSLVCFYEEEKTYPHAVLLPL